MQKKLLSFIIFYIYILRPARLARRRMLLTSVRVPFASGWPASPDVVRLSPPAARRPPCLMPSLASSRPARLARCRVLLASKPRVGRCGVARRRRGLGRTLHHQI